MTISKAEGSRLSLLSLFSTIVVVALQHFSSNLATTDDMALVYKNVVAHGIGDYAVSFFFMVSGYFIMRHYDGTAANYWMILRKRVQTLLIPYVVWNVVGAIVFGYTAALSALGVTALLPIVTPLWYVRNLLILSILIPLMVMVAKGILRTKASVFVALLAFGLACVWDFPAKKVIGMSVIYFQLGIVIALAPESWRSILHRFRFVGYCLFFACVAYATFCVCKGVPPLSCLRYIMIPSTIFSLCFLTGFIKHEIESPLLKEVFSLSFPIYVLHYFPLHYVVSREMLLTGWEVFAWSFCTVCGIGALVVVCRRIFPSGYRVVMGGR